MKIYKVGGAVRDRLLGLPQQDRDWVVVGATPEQMLAAGFRPVGRDFPVFLHPETKEEYALARTERKTGPGYKGFQIESGPMITLEEDLRRRDLTINAIAETEDGDIIDPFGGREDLQRRCLRHISEAFTEDPLRILRVARFAARFGAMGFHIAPETLELMRHMVGNGEINALVAERVWTEFDRALGETRPSLFITTLRQCNALAVVLPELDHLFGVPQSQDYHPEIDCGLHSLLVVDSAAGITADRQVRFAALVHDVGKGQTPKSEWPRHIGHESRGARLIATLCQRLRCPKDYREVAIAVARFHVTIHHALDLRPGTVLDTLEALDAFRRPDRLERILQACEADFRGRKGNESSPYPQSEHLTRCLQAARLIDSRPLVEAGLRGPAFGERLRESRLRAITAAISGQGGE